MLVQINYFLQLVLHAALYAVCSGAFVFSLMGTVNDRYAVLLELEDSGHSVINLSILSAFLLGPYVFTTTTWAMYKIVLYYKQAKMHSNFYMRTVIALAHLMALSCWVLFVACQPQIYKNGHLPVFDALARDYDRQSLCWNNIVFLSYEVHDANAINFDRNCVYQDNFMKKCVGCRMEIKHDEPTFFNQNQGALIMSVLLTIVVHCWNMYVQRKEMRRLKPAHVKQNRIGASINEVDSEYDSAEDEHQSNIRMLEIFSENRQINFEGPMSSFMRADEEDFGRSLISSFTQPKAASPPSSPDSGIGEAHCDIPKAIYKAPRKTAIPIPPPMPPPMPVTPIIARKTAIPIPPPKPVAPIVAPKPVAPIVARKTAIPIPPPKPVTPIIARSRPVLKLSF
ncbi:arif1 [Choristoneura murinana nucleopolyhedrovirus]|uniref:Arif1 n=1 Tax=Choristoneura murinana nucleopolyhedrovirus TaxID=1987479 RepID=V9XQ10_9ABAC|nr:arif1 [Choristoneura murinana nucleopolyhedrovirus]AHD25617.1 arif1 [Choristoneura murinana nucleopolyhedrovirus]